MLLYFFIINTNFITCYKMNWLQKLRPPKLINLVLIFLLQRQIY